MCSMANTHQLFGVGNVDANISDDHNNGQRHSIGPSHTNLMSETGRQTISSADVYKMAISAGDVSMQFPQIGMIWETTGFDTKVKWQRDPKIQSVIDVLKLRFGLNKVFEVKHMWNGNYNKFYSVGFDGEEYVMKIILPVCPRTKTESEVATMRWTAANTNLRCLVPTVKDYSSSANNPIGCEWILMTRLEGVSLSSCWRKIELGSKERIVRALAEYSVDVYHRPFKQIGNLFPTPILGRGRRYQVGTIASMRFFWNKGRNIEPQHGPFCTSKEWSLRRLNIAHEQLWVRFEEMKHWPRKEKARVWRMLSMSGVDSKLWRLYDNLFPPEEEDSDGHEVMVIGSPKLLTPPYTPSSYQGSEICSESEESEHSIDEDFDERDSSNFTTTPFQTITSKSSLDLISHPRLDPLIGKGMGQQKKRQYQTFEEDDRSTCIPNPTRRKIQSHLMMRPISMEGRYCSSNQQGRNSHKDPCHISGADTEKTKHNGFQFTHKKASNHSSPLRDQPNTDVSRPEIIHNYENRLARYFGDWEPLRPEVTKQIQMDVNLDSEAEPTMLWHDNISADNLLVDPETGRLTGILDWDCVSCLPVPLACDWPAFLHDGKHRTAEPEVEDFAVWLPGDESEGERTRGSGTPKDPKARLTLQENYWRAKRDFELTYLRKVFMQEMRDKCPSWYQTWQNSKVRKDYEAAVQNCDNEHVIHKVEAWCEAVEIALEKGQEIKPPQVTSLHCAIYEGPDWEDWSDLDDLTTQSMKPIREHEDKIAEWQDDLDEFHEASKALPGAKGTRTRFARERVVAERALVATRQARETATQEFDHFESLDEQGLDMEELRSLRQGARDKMIETREAVQKAEDMLATAETRAETSEERYEAAKARELAAMERIYTSEWFKKFVKERNFNHETWKNLEAALTKEFGGNKWWIRRLGPLWGRRRRKKPKAVPTESIALSDEAIEVSESESEISEEE
ncbi:hypothetical protein AB5N19_04003 [Seiridium cardinale]